MKKIGGLFLAFIFLALLANPAIAARRIVQMTIPGCFSWGASKRVGAILKNIDGVQNHQIKFPNIVIVTFDDEETTLKIIVRKLEEGTFPLDGNPVYLE